MLEQNQNDLLRLQVKALENKSKLLHDRIIQIKQTIAITENIIIERYDTTSLKAVIKLLQSSHKEIKKNIAEGINTGTLAVYSKTFRDKVKETNNGKSKTVDKVINTISFYH